MSRTLNGLEAAVVTVDPYPEGGVRTHIETAYTLMERLGISPKLIYTLAGPPLTDRQRRVNLRGQAATRGGMESFTIPRYPLPYLWTISPLIFGWQVIQQHDIHISVAGSCHVAFPLALRRMPFMLWMGTLLEDELRSQLEQGDSHARRLLTKPVWSILEAQERFILNNATHILTNSNHTARRVRQFAPRVADRVESLVIPVDTNWFRPDPAVQTGHDFGDYLLFVGRMNDPRKNVQLLLRAFAVVLQEFPHIKLVVAGEAPNQALLRLAEDLNLSVSVTFSGRISKDELLRLYQGATLFALPSDQEGLGLVVLEAMACGVPVVSTRCGGPEELIGQGEVGRLVPKGNEVAFAHAIIDMISQPARLARMRENCVRVVKEQFSWDVVEAQFSKAIVKTFPQYAEHVA